jgi:hypothetical protein
LRSFAMGCVGWSMSDSPSIDCITMTVDRQSAPLIILS